MELHGDTSLETADMLARIGSYAASRTIGEGGWVVLGNGGSMGIIAGLAVEFTGL